MKRICSLICCFLLVFSLCSCSAKKDELEEPVNFYYANAEITYHSSNGVLTKEVREGAGFHDNLSAFLHAYLRGPVSSDLQSIIPADVYLVSCEKEENIVTIVLSSQLSSLSGVRLTMACSALLLTVYDYTNIDTLCIRAKGEKLEDKDSIILSMDDVVLIDSMEIAE